MAHLMRRLGRSVWLQNTCLAVLAVFAIGASAYVVMSPVEVPVSEARSPDVAVDDVDQPPEDDGVVQEPSDPASTADDGSEQLAANVRQALAGTSPTVLVLTDASGVGDDTWPVRWARSRAEPDAPLVRQWVPGEGRFADADVEPAADGTPMTVWNLAQPGAGASYPSRRDRLAQVEGDPDVVILSYGHSNTLDNIGRHLERTADAVEERWGPLPMVLTIQNPSVGPLAQRDEDIATYLRDEWSPSEDMLTVDVAAAFADAERPLPELLSDNVRPNDAGTDLWVETLSERIG